MNESIIVLLVIVFIVAFAFVSILSYENGYTQGLKDMLAILNKKKSSDKNGGVE